MDHNHYLTELRRMIARNALQVSPNLVIPAYDTLTPKGEYQSVQMVSWDERGIPSQDQVNIPNTYKVRRYTLSYFELQVAIDFLRGDPFQRSNQVHAWFQSVDAEAELKKSNMSFVTYGPTRDLSFIETSAYTPRMQAQVTFGVTVTLNTNEVYRVERIPVTDTDSQSFTINLDEDDD